MTQDRALQSHCFHFRWRGHQNGCPPAYILALEVQAVNPQHMRSVNREWFYCLVRYEHVKDTFVPPQSMVKSIQRKKQRYACILMRLYSHSVVQEKTSIQPEVSGIILTGFQRLKPKQKYMCYHTGQGKFQTENTRSCRIKMNQNTSCQVNLMYYKISQCFNLAVFRSWSTHVRTAILYNSDIVMQHVQSPTIV